MGIVRTFMCGDCGHHLEVTLRFDQWDDPPPPCPKCSTQLDIDFRPIALGGSNRARAAKLAESIAEQDYGVADFKSDGRVGGRTKHRLRDQTKSSPVAWGATQEIIATAAALGRETRLKHGGDGLDMLQRALKDGSQPDLIELSKKRSMKIW